MSDFKAHDFFDLSTFVHSALFSQEEPVWSALSFLKNYFSTLPLGQCLGEIQNGAFLDCPELIYIGKGTKIESGAYIRGPCFIGENCEIRHGAYLRGHMLVGNHCVIGHATETKHSIFLDGAQAGHFAYVGDSIIGNDVNLGAGVKCANLRLDRKCVSISHKGVKLDTGLRKLGAIIGDGAQLGCNAVTNPGTIMGQRSGCAPCASVKGIVASETIVFQNNRKIAAGAAR